MSMKLILALAAIAVPVSAQLATTSTSGAAGTTAAQPGFPAASGAPIVAGPFGSGAVNVRPGFPGAPTRVPSGALSTPTLNPGAAMTPAPVIGASRFPPPGPGTVAPIVTDTGNGGLAGTTGPTVPNLSTFPVGTPPFVGNTVGQNFTPPFTNFPPSRALSVNLPPGATLQNQQSGLPSPVSPPPGLTPTAPVNTIGAPAGPEVGGGNGLGTPSVIVPSTAPLTPPAINPGARPPSVRR